jgi:hypothetical protein
MLAINEMLGGICWSLMSYMYMLVSMNNVR